MREREERRERKGERGKEREERREKKGEQGKEREERRERKGERGKESEGGKSEDGERRWRVQEAWGKTNNENGSISVNWTHLSHGCPCSQRLDHLPSTFHQVFRHNATHVLILCQKHIAVHTCTLHSSCITYCYLETCSVLQCARTIKTPKYLISSQTILSSQVHVLFISYNAMLLTRCCYKQSLKQRGS